MVDNLNSDISENLHNLVRLYEGATYFKNAADPQCNHTLLINSPRSFPNTQNSCNLRIFVQTASGSFPEKHPKNRKI